MKRLILLFAVLLICSNLAVAESASSDVDIDKALTYLKNNVNWNGKIDESSFALLALNNNGYSISVDNLTKRQSAEGCYPTGNCNIKDTALALLALSEISSKDTTKISSYLTGSIISDTSGTGDWLIQIATQETGNCTITSGTTTKRVDVDGNKPLKIGTKEVNWINVQSDLGVSLDKAKTEINLDCSDIDDQDIVISLLKGEKTGTIYTKFTILQQEYSQDAKLIIDKSCFGEKKDSTTCDLDATAYAYWALNKADITTDSAYLKTKAQTTIHNAILYSITGSAQYADAITQATDWKTDTYKAAFVKYALGNDFLYSDVVSNATKVIEDKYSSTTAWGASTGAIIYLAYTAQGSPVECDNDGECELGEPCACLDCNTAPRCETGGEIPPVCGDNLVEYPEECDDENTEDDDGCSSTCQNETACTIDSQCNTDLGEVCEDGTCVMSDCSEDEPCPTDQECNPDTQRCELKEAPEAVCGDGICDDGEDCTDDCTEQICDNEIDDDNDGDVDCDDSDCADISSCAVPESTFPWWIIWLSLGIIVLGLLGYLAYLYFKDPAAFSNLFKQKPKGPSSPSYLPARRVQQAVTRPSQPIRPLYHSPLRRRVSSRDEALERELDKSLEEAKKIIGK